MPSWNWRVKKGLDILAEGKELTKAKAIAQLHKHAFPEYSLKFQRTDWPIYLWKEVLNG